MSKIVKRIISGFLATVLFVSAFGSDVFTEVLEQNMYADSVESVPKKGKYEEAPNLFTDEKDTYDTGTEKLYNTNYGLHTDKTVSKAYDDGRTFDLDLESWYIGERPADVGMVLDASGSMAWTVDPLEPLTVESKDLEFMQSPTDGNVYIGEDGFLTTKDEEYLLEEDWTDNSRLSYTDYRYYVYDDKSATDEFVPLGYWDGTLQQIGNDPIETLKSTWTIGRLLSFFKKRNNSSKPN